MAYYSLRHADETAHAVQTYLSGQSRLSEPPRDYVIKLAQKYEEVCRDNIGAQSGTDGHVMIGDREAESRLVRTLQSFLPFQFFMSSDALASSFGSHLNGGEKCPDGTPANTAYINARMGSILIPGYQHELDILTFAVSSRTTSDSAEERTNVEWGDIFDEMVKEEGLSSQNLNSDPQLLKNVKEIMEKVVAGLNGRIFTGEELLTYQLLLNVIQDHARQRTGYKLLSLIEMKNGGPVLPVGLKDLIYAADGAEVPPLLESIFKMISAIDDVPGDLVRTLLKRSSVQPLGAARRFIIEKATALLAESKIELAEKLGRLLDDPTELQYMDAARSGPEYWKQLIVRKKASGGGAGGQYPYRYMHWPRYAGSAWRRFNAWPNITRQHPVWMSGARTMRGVFTAW